MWGCEAGRSEKELTFEKVLRVNGDVMRSHYCQGLFADPLTVLRFMGFPTLNFHRDLQSRGDPRESPTAEPGTKLVVVLFLLLFVCVLVECMGSGPYCLGSSPGYASSQLYGLGHLASPPWISVCTSVKYS